MLSSFECDQIRSLSQAMGYVPEAGGRTTRTNEQCVWIADETLWMPIWERLAPFMPKLSVGDHTSDHTRSNAVESATRASTTTSSSGATALHPQAQADPQAYPQAHPQADPQAYPHLEGCEAIGMNARWRCYRYAEGHQFQRHHDGAWSGSGMDADGRFVRDLWRGTRQSQMCAAPPIPHPHAWLGLGSAPGREMWPCAHVLDVYMLHMLYMCMRMYMLRMLYMLPCMLHVRICMCMCMPCVDACVDATAVGLSSDC